MQYSLNQYTLIPKSVSDITSRKSLNVFDHEGKMPVFVAPMTCILSKENFEKFNSSPFIPIYPVRYQENLQFRLNFAKEHSNCWIAVTLREFRDRFCSVEKGKDSYRILIDCADGHLKELYKNVKKAKRNYPNLEVMIGNIANPKAFLKCCRAGVDYVRVGIGGGNGCTTSVLTGFHASLPWLLIEISKLKKKIKRRNKFLKIFTKQGEEFCTKVVADGGIDTTAKALKCLALGADYVMMGKMFARCSESCGAGSDGTVEYYGQASTKGQLDRFGEVRSVPEGVVRTFSLKYSLDSLGNFLEGVFQSALSYGGAKNFEEFIGNVEYDIMSNSEFNMFNKDTE